MTVTNLTRTVWNARIEVEREIDVLDTYELDGRCRLRAMADGMMQDLRESCERAGVSIGVYRNGVWSFRPVLTTGFTDPSQRRVRYRLVANITIPTVGPV